MHHVAHGELIAPPCRRCAKSWCAPPPRGRNRSTSAPEAARELVDRLLSFATQPRFVALARRIARHHDDDCPLVGTH
jgi:hypothetical protein